MLHVDVLHVDLSLLRLTDNWHVLKVFIDVWHNSRPSWYLKLLLLLCFLGLSIFLLANDASNASSVQVVFVACAATIDPFD